MNFTITSKVISVPISLLKVAKKHGVFNTRVQLIDIEGATNALVLGEIVKAELNLVCFSNLTAHSEFFKILAKQAGKPFVYMNGEQYVLVFLDSCGYLKVEHLN